MLSENRAGLMSSDQIATFLNIAVPWTQGAYVNIHAFVIENGKLRPRGSRASQDVNSAASFCRWADSQGLEVYCCMSSQRQPGVGKTDSRGRTNYRALRGEANAVELRSFYVDVDVKEGAYASSQEALDALKAFCEAIALPPPSVVVWSGGGGFHAHWILDRPIAPTTWKPLAAKLADACRQKGLKADHAVTVDVARILRVPGTANRKYAAPVNVRMEIIGTQVLLEMMEQALAPFSGALANFSSQSPVTRLAAPLLDPKIFPGGTQPIDVSKFLAGVELPDPSIAEVAMGCPFVAETLRIGGAGYPEPLWLSTGHIAMFTSEGPAAFHAMSKGYHRYDPNEVDAKYAYVVQSQQASDRGWPRCATIENNGSRQCAGCTHRAGGKSPLNFAGKISVAPKVTPASNPTPISGLLSSAHPTIVTPPRRPVDVDGYMQNPHTGNIFIQTEEGQDEVWNYPVWNLEYRTDDGSRHGIHFDTQFDDTRWVHVVLPTGALAEARATREVIVSKMGLALHTDKTTGFMKFMSSFIEQLRSKKITAATQEALGWSLDPATGNPTGFIYSDYKFNCVGRTPFFQTEQIIKKIWSPTGSPEPWKAAIAMANAEKRPAIDLLIATAFAAPLMKFTGQSGVVVSGYSSGSAHHKTTGLKIGQATWGSQEGINQLTDTLNSVMEKVGKIKVLPVYYDEMKASTDVEKFSSMVFTIGGGRGKGRLGRNAEIRDVGTWDTLLVGASNDSLVSHLIEHDRSTEAGVNRVFEFEVPPPDKRYGQIDMGTAGKILTALKDNYGHAGFAYAEFLGSQVNTLPQRVTDEINIIEKAVKATQDERFWVAAMAVLSLGAQLSNSLNLTQFDVPAMQDFMVKAVERLRRIRGAGDMDVSKTDSLLTILAAYINANRKAIVITDTMQTAAGRRGRGQTIIVRNPEDARNSLRLAIHFAEDDNKFRISKAHFGDWLRARKLPGGVIMPNLLKAYNASEITTRIGVGTDFNNVRERLIELDCNTNPDLDNLLSN